MARRVHISGRTKPANQRLRYNPQFWGRFGGQPNLALPMLVDGPSGRPLDYSHKNVTGPTFASWLVKAGRFGGQTGAATVATGTMPSTDYSSCTIIVSVYKPASGFSNNIVLGFTTDNPLLIDSSGKLSVQWAAVPWFSTTAVVLTAGAWNDIIVSINKTVANSFVLMNGQVAAISAGTGASPGITSNAIQFCSYAANQIFWATYEKCFILPYPISTAQAIRLASRPWAMFERRRPEAVAASGNAIYGALAGISAGASSIASSLIAVVGGIVSTFNLVASSLYDAAAGIQSAAAEAVASNLTSGAVGISALAVEQVLSNFASASASMNAAAAQQVLTNLIAASGGIAGSQSLITSSIISVLANIQAVAEQSTAIAAQGLAGFAATGDVQVLNNLIALNEQLSAAASFVASSIYSAAARVDGPGSVAVLINLLLVAERVQALAQQLASSVNAMQAGSGASATVIASSLYRASAGCGAFATVSAILDAAICELASIRPSYTAEAILRAMYQSAAGVRPSYAAKADIDGC